VSYLKAIGLLLILCCAACHRESRDPIYGRWNATVLNKAGDEVAFTLDVKREGDRVVGALVNGDDRVVSTDGQFDGHTLKLRYDFYDGELTAALAGARLEGSFDRQWRHEKLSRAFKATRRTEPDRLQQARGGPVDGDWLLRVGDQGKERVWRASFRQTGNQVTGTIIPLSGDWGTLTGSFDGEHLAISRFDGINAHLFTASLTTRGTLEGRLDSELKVTAERPASSALSAPDAGNVTRVKNPAEAFRFSFPDADGHTISSTDARFQNKVIVVTITGSWCPNCHDEAEVLKPLYEKYHDRGLEIVSLAFEYTGDVSRDAEQLRIFSRRHQISYPVLLAGTTDEGDVVKKLPQFENFSAFPTTLFIGRDGLVKRVHAGFDGPATGERYTRLKAEVEETIRRLLDEPRTSTRRSSLRSFSA
jgi:peroxiredoxin